MKKSKNMAEIYIKYWLTYCISIDVQIIYTLSHSCTRLCQQPHHKNSLTQAWKARKIRRVKRKQTKNKYICVHIHEYVFLNDCLRSESESASQHSSPPQLKGV